LRLKQRLIDLPPDVDIVDFNEYDGNPPASTLAETVTKNTTLAMLRDRLLATHEGAEANNSLNTARTHFKHVVANLGQGFLLAALIQVDLQQHANLRADKEIASVTIRKEIHGLRATWSWGRRSGLVATEWPGKELVYRKTAVMCSSPTTKSPYGGDILVDFMGSCVQRPLLKGVRKGKFTPFQDVGPSNES
jgi:hypothetical protein